MVAYGAGKADIVGRIFGPDVDPSALPAQLALRDGATWLLDEAAAARLATVTTVRERSTGHPPCRSRRRARHRRGVAGVLACHVRLPAESSRRRRPPLAGDRARAEARDVGRRRPARGRARRRADGAVGRPRWSSCTSRPSGSASVSAGVSSSSPRRAVRRASSCTASRSMPSPAGSTSSHGFVPIAFGDGSGNEERQPDVLYRWRPEGGVVAAEPPA